MFVMPLNELGLRDFTAAGGKAANLGVLIQAGFPVPPGFCILTNGYRFFIETNNLRLKIESCISALTDEAPDSFEKVSAEIRAGFSAGLIPNALAEQIRLAYRNSGFTFTAVRSSATMEDLPDMSFAGQQDTYLHVKGETNLLEAVQQCWGSLWTARALAYRLRNRLPQIQAALAVVVQRMVASETSGVLFTANPLTGKRSETVIDAAPGLGEALVSGLVIPDHYLIDHTVNRILRKVPGNKNISIRGQEQGGTVTIQEKRTSSLSLEDEQVLELTALGRQAEQVFGSPQDLEWALAAGKIHIVQSRPITSLYPLPAEIPSTEVLILFSLGAIQGMLEPFTPLGRDNFRLMAVSLNRLLGRRVTMQTQQALFEAGERLFLNFTSLFRSGLGRKFLRVIISSVEPGSHDTIETLFQDQRFSVKSRFMKLRTCLALLRLLLPVAVNTLLNLLFPGRAQKRISCFLKKQIFRLTKAHAAVINLAQRIRCIEKSTRRLLRLSLFSHLIPAVSGGQAALQLLRRMCGKLPDGDRLVMELTRGLSHNVTTEMDLLLWQIACRIKADPEACGYFRYTDPVRLCQLYFQVKLPVIAQQALQSFLNKYGMRGLFEIDLGRHRWQENPEPLIRVIISYLEITDPAQTPEVVFQKGIAAAEAAKEKLLKLFRDTPGYRHKAARARFFISRIRCLTGLRETPKFSLIQIMTMHRQGLLASGKELVQAGILREPGDIFFLQLMELKALDTQSMQDWQAVVTRRKEVFAREKLRKTVPRIILSDGTTFFQGMSAEDNPDSRKITGSPVSAGVTEGVVHVIFDPQTTQLSPGEILVCRGTDPAWTPLFLAAAGLVMEVGGMMTHGSVVAREYGIPAIVGVDQATSRLKTGQRIRMDGLSGKIQLL